MARFQDLFLLGGMERQTELKRRNWKNGAVAVFDAILTYFLLGSVNSDCTQS